MRKILSLLTVLGLVLILSVGTIGSAPADTIKIGVLGKSVHPYWAVVEQGMKDAAKLFPEVEATFYVPTTEDIQKQISTLESWIAQGFDGIAFAPSDPDAVISVIKDATERGIPTLTIDTDAPKTDRLLYMGTDNYTAGTIAGKKMAEVLGGEGQVVILTGSLTAMNSLQRIQGFKDALEGTDIEVLTTLNDREDAARSLANAEQALTTYPELDAFFGVYAYNGPAGAKALKGAGIDPGEIKVVCFDTTDEHLMLIDEGYIQATMGQRQYFMGYHSVSLFYLMAKENVDNVLMLLPRTEDGDIVVDTGVDVVTKDKLGWYCEQMDKWGVKSEFC